MDLLFVILVAPLFCFWWHLLLGLVLTRAAMAAIRRSGTKAETGDRLEWTVAVSGPIALFGC